MVGTARSQAANENAKRSLRSWRNAPRRAHRVYVQRANNLKHFPREKSNYLLDVLVAIAFLRGRAKRASAREISGPFRAC